MAVQLVTVQVEERNLIASWAGSFEAEARFRSRRHLADLNKHTALATAPRGYAERP